MTSHKQRVAVVGASLKRGLRVKQLHRAIERAARHAGFEIEQYGKVDRYPLYCLTRQGRSGTAHIYVSAGMHGDEPAGPLAILGLLRTQAFSEEADWFVCPMLNPSGLQKGTRENYRGVDLNRDYHEADRSCVETRAHIAWLEKNLPFDLAILMHEDWESDGFYVNEFKTGPVAGLDERVIAAVSAQCRINQNKSIDEMAAEHGIVHPFRSGYFGYHWPESFFLRHHGVGTGMNFETPSCLPLRIRLAAQRIAFAVATSTFLARGSGENDS